MTQKYTIPDRWQSSCYDLATACLESEPHLATTVRTDTLAELIQATIEDYINSENRNYDGGEP